MAEMKAYSSAEADLAAAREELRQGQAHEARLQKYAWHKPMCRAIWGARPRLECDCGFDAALAERGDNPVLEVVEAARKFLPVAFDHKYNRPAAKKLREALARLDGSAEGKG